MKLPQNDCHGKGEKLLQFVVSLVEGFMYKVYLYFSLTWVVFGLEAIQCVLCHQCSGSSVKCKYTL